MKIVIITGSTRGIGYGLAEEFLRLGHKVVISGRSQGSVDKAVEKLASSYDPGNIAGQPCDVTSVEQVQALWDAAVSHFGHVDIWISNAGLGNKYRPPWEQDLAAMETLVKTNVLGVMYGTSIAYKGMLSPGFRADLWDGRLWF